jgi:surface protein
MENLNTSEVTDMSYMFSGINPTNLALDLTHFDTSKVTDMSYMFYNVCHGGRSDSRDAELDLSSFTFKSSTNTTGLLEGAFLNELTIPASANYLASDAFLNMNSADDPCTLICPDGFVPDDFTYGNGYKLWKGGYFSFSFVGNTKEAYYDQVYEYDVPGDPSSGIIANSVTFYYDNLRGTRNHPTLLPTNGGKLGIVDGEDMHQILISFDSSFADYHPTSTKQWFKDLKAETVIDFDGMENLKTDQVTDMSGMFQNLFPNGTVTDLDLSHFDTSNVTDMSYMFSNTNLGSEGEGTYADLSSFTFKSSTNTTGLLKNTSSLTTLTINSTANYLASNAFSGVGTSDYPCLLICPDDFTPQGATQGNGYIQWKGGYFKVVNKEAYALVSSDGETMTFYYDEKRNSRTEGTTYLANNKINYDPEWFGTVETIKKVVFHPSFAYARPTNTSLWFNGMKNLTSIEDIKYLNTSEVTHTISMFKDCKNLKTLDVSNFNTDKVEDMANMFSGCNSLEALDVSNFNTDKVTYFSFMFSNCSSLKTLNVYNFYTDRATDMSGFFAGCSNLETLDVSNFYTDNVMLMPFMFAGCSNLKTIDLSNFNTANVTDMRSMFFNCTSLESLDLSNFNTDNVTSMGSMFSNCSSLESLDLSNFNTANVTDMRSMFFNCTSLKSLDLSSFNTAKVTDMVSMFSKCTSMETLDLSNFTFDASNDTYYMMYGCNNLKLLSIPASVNNLEASTCRGVGTEECPCLLKYPEGASANLGIPEEYDNYFIWKDGYFTDIYLGDANGDDRVTIADVMMTVKASAGDYLNGFIEKNADINHDNTINVTDVMLIVKMLQ